MMCKRCYNGRLRFEQTETVDTMGYAPMLEGPRSRKVVPCPVCKKFHYEYDHMDEILLRCCAMRGIHPEQFHRTLKEFDWFVTTLMFRKDDEYEKYRKMVFPFKSDKNVPIDYTKAFEMYCSDYYLDKSESSKEVSEVPE